tara:strand:- start:3240 stop:3932 length:693 start_codon:yes stop_codon:yes gene_type:complete
MAFLEKKVFALIPARKGSKGLKDKNIFMIKGKPLIEHTLASALKSKFIDEIFVSTNCKKVKKITSKYEDILSIDRPEKFCKDNSPAKDVVNHFIYEIEKDFKKDFIIIYLQPTSPLRTHKHINECFEAMKQFNKLSSVSVVKSKEIPFKSFKLNKNGLLKSLFNEEKTNYRRQDLPSTYQANGAIYIFTKNNFKRKKIFPSNNSLPYIMSAKDSIDIDLINDIKKAESYI